MPGWCNGTAGYVHVWVLAHQALGDERYLRLAERAAWNAFEEAGLHGRSVLRSSGTSVRIAMPLQVHPGTGMADSRDKVGGDGIGGGA